mgnify:CR=1 FL=1
MIQVRMVESEVEALDHRRARLCAIVESGVVSDEMKRQLRSVLADIERRLSMLRARSQPQPQRQAA